MAHFDRNIFSDSSFLNPGPAPRPPTTQSQSSRQISASSPIHTQHASISTMNTSSPYASSTNLITVGSNGSAQNGGNSPVSNLGDIRKGWGSVKEDGIKSLIWQKKYMVLREISLDFYRNEQATSTSLCVPLRDIVSVNRVELKPYCIEIVRSAGAQGTGLTTMASDAPRRTIYISLKSDPELYAWMDDVYSRCPSMGGVSNPTNFTHKVHVGFDPVSGGFTGLPEEWSKLLNSSAITKEDYQKNPQAVIEVLEFYTEGKQRMQDPAAYPGMAATPPQIRTPFPPPPSSGPRLPGPQRQDSRDREQWEKERQQQREDERQRDQQMREKEEQERRQRELEKQQERRDRERRERQDEEDLFNRRQQEQEDLPQKATAAQTPILMSGGGGGGFSSSSARNPMAAKSTKIPQKAPSTRDLNPQRAAPRAPAAQQQPRQPSPATNLRVGEQKRDPSPAARQQDQKPAGAVKPLNVPNKTPAKEVQAREQRKENKRISNMTEAQVMEKLRSVVSSGDPNQSYTKIKKVGQGASGSVYVAKINGSPASATAAGILRNNKNGRVAIKQMDLAHQPRKELIVNEILVMKESQHPNIVNFLDAFLKGNTELWVVMEYMEGGALTDVIDNNTLEEDQIATICFEVWRLLEKFIVTY